MSKNLVIVESPAKAHTIEKYLGSDFKVLASVGHIRKDTKVDKSTFDVTYEIDPGHKQIIAELKKEAKAAERVWLATDEDREGESISWHLTEVLKLPKDTARITFHEITKPALENAIKNPRTVDMNMVSSQQARQTLDMLVGYDLSDIVRRKVPGAISAGRVQSPALRLVVEREKDIEKFESKSSFKVTGMFAAKSISSAGPAVASSPTHAGAGVPQATSPADECKFSAAYDGEAPQDEQAAKTLLERLAGAEFVVTEVEEAEGTKSNPVPFTTAALQIEANAKLGFSSRTTMSAAQGLYQAGLITYHRTDSLNLSSQAIGAIAGFIKSEFGDEYLKTRHFKTKDASAQEAHEAIRPTDVRRMVAGKNDYEKRLYQLIWARTVATQMANARVAKTTIRIGAVHEPTESADTFVAKGEVVIFDGFLKVYGNSKDLQLPKVAKGDPLDYLSLTARQNFAKPPARYTEGSLVKKLEELGIGRPSTYASIMSAIQARGYVVKGESEGEEREVVELSVEPILASAGPAVASSPTHAGAGVPQATSPADATTTITRSVVKEKHGANKGKLIPTPIGELVAGFLTDNFKNIVDYKFTANIEKDLDLVADAKLERVKMLRDFYGPFHDTVLMANGVERYNNARLLGHDPETGKPIYAKVGKNGGFIQLGDNEKECGEKPRFAPLPKRKSVKTVTLEHALKQLALPALPRTLGKAADGTELIAANGPFGPYLKGGKYNIPMKDFDPYTVTLEDVLPLYQRKIDSMIADWGEIQIINGAYGPYVKGPGRRNNVKVPKDLDPKTITEAQAREMLENKPKTAAKTRRRVRGGRGKATSTAKKASVAKGSSKKATTTKKSSAQK
ncbi:type I DNA topoisomerase [Candidatus Saccharibacteria bacterium]|nr:type I DNA topoisomerase [Candidatus Saccharibacteria bacterium]